MSEVSKINREPGAYNYIGGKWLKASSGESFPNVNPATGEILGQWPSSGKKEVDGAVAAAKRALESWRKLPAPKRAEYLLKAHDILVSRKEDYARAMTQEMGKVLKETRGDVQEAIDTALYFTGEGRRLFGETTTSELADKFAMTVRMPVGVCALITPWNFPMAIPSWKVFPALICGNTLVLKPASYTPASATLLIEALAEAGVPAGVVNLVHGGGGVVGNALVEHPDVRLVSFTGSSDVGAGIAARCGQLFKKVTMEMGGKNAQIIMDDADIDLAVEGAVWGAFGTTGQRCTATSRIIVHDGAYKAFMDKFTAKVGKLRLGNGLDEKADVGPLVSDSQLKVVEKYVAIAQKEDKAKLLAGGRPVKSGDCAQGFFYEPTVFEGTPGMRIAQEEIFGPVVVILRVKSFEEAITVLNDTKFGLSGSVYTKDINRVMKAIRDMETGITYINAPTIGAEVHLPFGGVKQTGNGHREAGQTVLEIYTEWKSVFVDYSGRLQKAQIEDNPDKK
ncbi:MAG: aldehyde dehydrogenase family protein [Elusimicrobia bacterium]|nr:aldehyde dehydrogenase family protein [Elusimicrobiota bacterium]